MSDVFQILPSIGQIWQAIRPTFANIDRVLSIGATLGQRAANLPNTHRPNLAEFGQIGAKFGQTLFKAGSHGDSGLLGQLLSMLLREFGPPGR